MKKVAWGWPGRVDSGGDVEVFLQELGLLEGEAREVGFVLQQRLQQLLADPKLGVCNSRSTMQCSIIDRSI